MEQKNDFADWLLVRLGYAYMEARKGKRRTEDEHLFELNLFENLVALRDDILNRTYEPSAGTAFVVDKPVTREIFAAPFRDRAVHHILYDISGKWWDDRMIYDSYSCRVGKGTLFGIKRLAYHIRSASDNYTKKTYVIKLDLKGYFMSLPRSGLYQKTCWGLDRQFPNGGQIYEMAKFLWRKVIFDDPTKGVRLRGSVHDWDRVEPSKSLFCQPPEQGIVIGNLSSQSLSNNYLDTLDRFVKFDLGYEHYGRYVDDFFIVVTEDKFQQALRDIDVIEQFLAEMGLTLHPKKRYIQPIERGVPFLGAVVYPGRIVPGKRIKKNFYDAMERFAAGEADKEAIISYLGHIEHFDSKKLRRGVLGTDAGFLSF